MREVPFSLRPFSGSGSPPALKIKGDIKRHSDILAVRYIITGHLGEIIIPAMSENPARKKALWEATCLELFLSPEDSDQYWEFNLSPAGHWNVYHFSAYREGMREETAINPLNLTVETDAERFRLTTEYGLGSTALSGHRLNAGISAVIESIHGGLSYWASAHKTKEPDFHCKDSFIIKI